MNSRFLVAALTTGIAAVAGATAQSPAPGADLPAIPSLTIKITSPLGRTGITGPVRIVARVGILPETVISPIQFFVDDKLVGEDKDGPPYAVEWVDDNPFATRRIVAQVADSRGSSARDTVELEPLEILESTNVSSVLLEPSVIDKTGRPVNNLTLADFTVFENGVQQDIDLAVPDTVPATYTLLVDSSQSMSRRMPFVLEAAGQLPQRLRSHDSVMVVPFSRALGAITGPTQDRETIAGAISGIRSGGGTAILESLTTLAKSLRRLDGRHIVVLITDGYDENSEISYGEAMEALRASQATVYVVAVAGVAGISLKGEELLRKLASETGGRAFFPARDIQLAEMNDRIAADVQQRYVLTYTSKNRRLDGTWRAIKLTTTDPTRTIRVRTGYYAPEPPPIKPQIELTVKDLNRQHVDVSAEDLIVIEDGVEQKVEGFEESLTPVSLVLSLDSSGSIRADAPVVLDAARSFVRALPAKSRLALMMFADKSVMAHDLTTLREWTLNALGRYTATGGTALYDALWDGITVLEPAEGRKAIVILTDGRDENNPGTAPGSTHTLHQVLESLRDRDTVVYAIGLGAKVDRETLEKIANASGGEAYFPLEVSELDREYQRILENLRRRHMISYTSTNRQHDGKWREVEIRAKREGIRIHSRGGYFAPDEE